MNLQTLKLEALGERQYLNDLVELYEDFQHYIECLQKFMKDKLSANEFRAEHLRYKTKFEEYDNLFLEWHQGEQLYNSAVYSLVVKPLEDLHQPDIFRDRLMEATVKFEHLIRKQEKSLRRIHERITVVAGKQEAEETTTLSTTLEDADKVGELGLKWGGRLIKFAAWAQSLLS